MLIDRMACMGYILKFPLSKYPIHFTAMGKQQEKMSFSVMGGLSMW
jgi:hypothetical protein